MNVCPSASSSPSWWAAINSFAMQPSKTSLPLVAGFSIRQDLIGAGSVNWCWRSWQSFVKFGPKRPWRPDKSWLPRMKWKCWVVQRHLPNYQKGLISTNSTYSSTYTHKHTHKHKHSHKHKHTHTHKHMCRDTWPFTQALIRIIIFNWFLPLPFSHSIILSGSSSLSPLRQMLY